MPFRPVISTSKHDDTFVLLVGAWEPCERESSCEAVLEALYLFWFISRWDESAEMVEEVLDTALSGVARHPYPLSYSW